jgi:hypothetical protein
VTRQDQMVAMVVPAKPVTTPDFLARTKAVWGEATPGKSLRLVARRARGGVTRGCFCGPSDRNSVSVPSVHRSPRRATGNRKNLSRGGGRRAGAHGPTAGRNGERRGKPEFGTEANKENEGERSLPPGFASVQRLSPPCSFARSRTRPPTERHHKAKSGKNVDAKTARYGSSEF